MKLFYLTFQVVDNVGDMRVGIATVEIFFVKCNILVYCVKAIQFQNLLYSLETRFTLL